MNKLTHFTDDGAARMVDVSGKEKTTRTAVARGEIKIKPETLKQIEEENIAKGDVLNVARVAGINAVKKTPDLIPMCHPLLIGGVEIDFKIKSEAPIIEIRAKVKNTGQTGVEMEALTAVSTAALTIYDMCKAVDKTMEIGEIKLLKKSGGQSGDYIDSALKGEIVSCCISKEKGTTKDEVDAVDLVKDYGIKDDAHAGAKKRQVSLLTLEDIDRMRDKGLELSPGDFGENLITRGIDLSQVEIGDQLEIGDNVVVEITKLGKECHDRCNIYYQAGDCIMPRKGVFARVLVAGKVSSGDKIEVVINA